MDLTSKSIKPDEPSDWDVLSKHEVQVLIDWSSSEAYKVLQKYLKGLMEQRIVHVNRSVDSAVSQEDIVKEVYIGRGRMLELTNLLKLPGRLKDILDEKKHPDGSKGDA